MALLPTFDICIIPIVPVGELSFDQSTSTHCKLCLYISELQEAMNSNEITSLRYIVDKVQNDPIKSSLQQVYKNVGYTLKFNNNKDGIEADFSLF